MNQHYLLQNADSIPSPSLVVYVDHVKSNLQRAVALVGDPSRLRPHVKTHKCQEIVRLELEMGITKHKCATLREAEMLAETGATDILIAYPVLGPNVDRFVQLVEHFPNADFKPIVDSPIAVRQLSEALARRQRTARVLLDVDLGGHRTGIPISEAAHHLYRTIADSPGLEPYGIHAYDGPTTEQDSEDRKALCRQFYQQVCAFREKLQADGLEAPLLVMGGTPSFLGYAPIADVEVSPGTFVLHDYNYTTRFPDLGFTPAAFLLSRVISASHNGLATLDLGYKAISPDSAVRGAVWGREDIQMGPQTEEHWVLELPRGNGPAVGDTMLVCPGHICPTVALHDNLVVLNADGEWVDTWRVAARGRQLHIEATH